MAYKNRPAFTPIAERKFLDALTQGKTVGDACKESGLSRRVVYHHRANDEAFAEAWTLAYDEGSDLLEREAQRRAVEGIEQPVYQKGERVGTVREYSDNLLILLLKARRPDKFRERVDMTSGDKPLQILGTALLQAAHALDNEAVVSDEQRATH